MEFYPSGLAGFESGECQRIMGSVRLNEFLFKPNFERWNFVKFLFGSMISSDNLNLCLKADTVVECYIFYIQISYVTYASCN